MCEGTKPLIPLVYLNQASCLRVRLRIKNKNTIILQIFWFRQEFFVILDITFLRLMRKNSFLSYQFVQVLMLSISIFISTIMRKRVAEVRELRFENHALSTPKNDLRHIKKQIIKLLSHSFSPRLRSNSDFPYITIPMKRKA
jgi:hypothetical protein